MSEFQDAPPEGGERRWKAVYTIVDGQKGDRKYWLRIGIAFMNRDQSLNVKLDAMPVNGTLHIREETPREDARARPAAVASAPAERTLFAGKGAA